MSTGRPCAAEFRRRGRCQADLFERIIALDLDQPVLDEPPKQVVEVADVKPTGLQDLGRRRHAGRLRMDRSTAGLPGDQREQLRRGRWRAP